MSQLNELAPTYNVPSSQGHSFVMEQGYLNLFEAPAIATVGTVNTFQNILQCAGTWTDLAPVNLSNHGTYVFSCATEHYVKIFFLSVRPRCQYITSSLECVSRDDDENEVISEKIAHVIDLVGEPAVLTVAAEAFVNRGKSRLDWLLISIASSRHKESEASRFSLLKEYANDPDGKVRRAAVRALGRMEYSDARTFLSSVAQSSGKGESKEMARAYLR